ncbi:MAG: hypothetical protein IT432_15950 [Phycisphaerales bacterium]|nr:hypothetical protein [Phycisphaerales bacterium]
MTDGHADMNASAANRANLESRFNALLDAALGVLAARESRMLTIEEWAGLARTVAECQGRRAAEYLTDDDLSDIADGRIDWDEAIDGPLPAIE